MTVQGSTRWGLLGVALCLGFLMALAGLIRSLGFEFVFVGDQVVFPPADAQYHVRRAFYTFVNFPAVLLFDPYINYPGGASVPWPPLFDFALGGVARLLADDSRGFEGVVAWAGPVCGMLTLPAIYWAGRVLASGGAGLAAALCYACLPIAVTYSRVGNPDHHAGVAMLGAWLLLACLGLVAKGGSARFAPGWGILLGVAQWALLMTWHGSLLYLGIANALLLAVGIAGGRRALLRAQAGAAAAAAGLLVPVLLVSPEPLGGFFSSIALSWLHVLAAVAVVMLSGAVWLCERPGLSSGPARRGAVAAGGALFFAALAAGVPEIREGIRPALLFLTQADEVGAITWEQSPLFGAPVALVTAHPVRSWGWFAYTIPFVPVVAGAWAWSRREAGAGFALLAAWALIFALLTLDQRRYGNDFAPAFALVFGLAAFGAVERVVARLPSRSLRSMAGALGVAGLTACLLWPVINAFYGPLAAGSLAALGADAAPRRAVTGSVANTLARFVGEVRRVTPATSGYLGSGPGPEYGIIAHPNYGHAIQYGARRATATDPFWWYIGRANWDATLAFLGSSRETEALEWAERLRGRYVVTTREEDPASVSGQLHEYDGRAAGSRPVLEHFRLVAESPPGGRALGAIARPRAATGIAYKLFEIVPGARLVVDARPGSAVVATLALRSSQGRGFAYAARGVADANGEARLRLPYATEGARPPGEPSRTRAQGLYTIAVDGRAAALAVSEHAVVSGAEVRLAGD